MEKILVLHKAKAKLTDTLLFKQFQAFGFALSFLEFPEHFSLESLAAFGPLHSFWAYGLTDAQLNDLFAVNKTQNLPVFALCDKIEKPTLVPNQVDDLFALSGSAEELFARVSFRKKQVTERTEQAKIAALEKAKTEVAMRQREEFLSVCAHDLRSPLGIIQASIGMILKDNKLNEFQTELLTRSKRQSAQAITLIHDLLDVMTLEQGLKPQYQMIRLHDVLNDFYKDYKFQAEQKNIKFHYENPIQEWRFLGDADRVRQLFQNLVTNALKFTEPGKNIYLKVTPFQGRRKNDPPHPMLVISLQDEGKGMAHSDMQKIFDRFSQIKTAQRAEGRGLGLTVAKQISNLHDGNIWVESEEGKGSTFYVLFPHVISQWEVSAPKAKAKKKVLVVEASEKRRDEYFNILERWGYEVHFAKDGVEALTLLHHHQPQVLVLTPRMDKIEETAIADIVKENPTTAQIPILFATEKEDVEKGPFDALLAVPFSKESFAEAVASVKPPPTPKKKAA